MGSEASNQPCVRFVELAEGNLGECTSMWAVTCKQMKKGKSVRFADFERINIGHVPPTSQRPKQAEKRKKNK